MDGKSAVCGVVVTYQPTEEVIGNLRKTVSECGQVLVVDNGSARDTCDRIGTLPGVIVMRLESNLGVAAALNRGAMWAREHGFRWIVTFDQDSNPASGFLSGLWATYARHPNAGLIGPRIREEGRDASLYRWVRKNPRMSWFFQRAECNSSDLTGVTLLVSSGSLLELNLWQQLGGFDEGLFIDYVDTDYCLKVVRAGRTLVVSAGATLNHRLGARKAGRFVGKDLRPMHHPPSRHYYIARNRVRIWRRHAIAVPHWALFDLCFAFLNAFRAVVLESEKRAKLKALLLGTWDGLRGRTGRCPDNRLRALRS